MSRNQAANDLAACPFGAMELPGVWLSISEGLRDPVRDEPSCQAANPSAKDSGQWQVEHSALNEAISPQPRAHH